MYHKNAFYYEDLNHDGILTEYTLKEPRLFENPEVTIKGSSPTPGVKLRVS
jgi:hypothetical protein